MSTREARGNESTVEVSVRDGKTVLDVSLNALPIGFKLTENVRLRLPCELVLNFKSTQMDVCEERRRRRHRRHRRRRRISGAAGAAEETP